MYLQTQMNPILGSGWVGPPGSKFGLNRVGLVEFIWPHYPAVSKILIFLISANIWASTEFQ